jgi:beta-galactosidase
MTRRDLLTQTARGAILLSASPLLGRAEPLLAAEEAAAPVARSRESFDFGWRFFKGDATGAEEPAFADASWREVDLPHDWSIEGPFLQDAPSSGAGAYLPTGIGWYRKRFRLGDGNRDRIVTLEFDGVYQNSEVWINGHSLGLRPYGYVPFAYELTPHLNWNGENVVAVRVDNSRQTNCRWYSGSGIYRHTWLLTTGPVRVAYWGTTVTTPRVSTTTAGVQVKTRVANARRSAAMCSLSTELLDAQGKIVGTQEASQGIGAGDTYEFVQELAVESPHLWSPTTPALYTVRSTVQEAGEKVDVYETPLGIRQAEFDAERGFVLNGQRVKLNGVCLHHEAGCVGAAVPEAVWERRLSILRAMGCNAIRTSHNPYAAEFLDLCDRMGFLVMAEAFDEWRIPKGQIRYGYHLYFDEWHERDVKAMLHRDRNHPSIVLWSAGNEIPDQSAEDGAQTLRGLLEIFHAEDPTRPVTVACDRIASEPASNTVRPEFLALLDVVGYNYVDRWRGRADQYYAIEHAAFPNRRVIGTESGAMGGIRGDYRFLFPAEATPAQRRFLLPTNRALDVEELWQFVRTYDYVSGDFMWTGIDYLGEAFWPFKSSPAGAIDSCGFPKDGYFFYQSQWTEKPMVHLFPHWNWKGREGSVIPVTCYTNCDTVELFVNGKSFGEKGYEFPRLGMEGEYGNEPARARALRTTSDLHLSWDVPYEAGTLRAVGTKDGQVVTTVEVSTTGEPAALLLVPDRTSLTADRRDVAHLVVEVRDEQGRRVPIANNAITFAVEGEARLIGVDNGDPQSHEDYKGSVHAAFNGLCLALIQTTARAGAIRIMATSPGLHSASATLAAKIQSSSPMDPALSLRLWSDSLPRRDA